MGIFHPDKYFARISAIDVPFDLLDRGFNHALLDVDNTIRARDTHDIPKDVRIWLEKATSAGVEFCLVSNNWHKDIYDFADSLEMPVVAKALKPIPFAILAGMRKIGGTRENTVFIGDQIFTDVVGAHISGLTSYLVAPLVEADLKHTLFLRGIENRILVENAQGFSQAKGSKSVND